MPCYNITSSDIDRFCWFRVAKSGTRTILKILSQHSTFSVNAGDVCYDAGKYRDYFKFAFVRNPWDRVVSCYLDKVVNKRRDYYMECHGKDFEYFVRFIKKKDLSICDRHIRLQSRLFPYREVDFIGRFENFENDLRSVLDKLNIKVNRIPRLNVTKRTGAYKSYYSERTKHIIADKYSKDVELFGYKF